jgi:hypothetical protein
MKTRHLVATVIAAFTFAAPALLHPAGAREEMTDEEMSEARGGVLVAGNLAFEFGAVMKTYEDGVLALQTQVNWTPQGQQITQTVGPDVTQINDQAATGANAALNTAVANAIKSPQSVYQTSSGATLVQQAAQNQLLNLVMNTGSGHDFRTDTSVNLVLPGFAATQANITQNLTALRVGQEVGQMMSTLH